MILRFPRHKKTAREIARNKLIAKDKMMAQYSSGFNIPSRAGSSEKKNQQKWLLNGRYSVSDNGALNLRGKGQGCPPYLYGAMKAYLIPLIVFRQKGLSRKNVTVSSCFVWYLSTEGDKRNILKQRRQDRILVRPQVSSSTPILLIWDLTPPPFPASRFETRIQ